MQRRGFLVLGVTGAAALAAAGWWQSWRRLASGSPDHEAFEIVRAIVPAMLAGALPRGSIERAQAIEETVAGVARAIAGLPPFTRNELSQLFALLGAAPARRLFAGVATPWPQAGVDEIGAFLDRWRDSGWALKRSAYNALHQLVIAAWYGNERSWAAIGYPGPPTLTT
jgi:hypothetical protein